MYTQNISVHQAQGGVLHIEQVAELIGKAPATIRGCVTSRDKAHRVPPPFKLPGSRRLCWRAADVHAWIAAAAEGVAVSSPRRRGRPRKTEARAVI